MKRAILAACVALFAPVHAAPIPVSHAERDSGGVTLAMQPGILRLQVCTDRCIRVIYSPTATLPKLENFIVINPWTSPVPFQFHDDAQTVTLTTDKLEVRVDKSDGALHFLDPAGRIILEEPPGGGKSAPQVTVNHENAIAPEQVFLSPPEESIWGLGQHPQGTWNWRGMPYQLRQVDTDIALPMIVSSRGYGILWDNASLTDFNPLDRDIPIDPKTHAGTFTSTDAGDYVFMTRDGDAHNEIGLQLDGHDLVHLKNMFVPFTVSAQTHLEANQSVQMKILGGGAGVKLQGRLKDDRTVFRSQVGDAIDYTFFYGPSLDDVIAGYREATGAAPMWPEWAFGFWQCREHYDNQQQLLDAARGFRDHDIPIDLIIQDWQYWGPLGWGAYQWDPKRYPDPAAMIKQLHDEHIHFMISTWSNPHGIAGDALAAAHLLIDNGNNFVEVTNPAARAMRWDYVNRAFFSIGTDGWWQDCTEPNDFGDVMEDRQFFLGSSNRFRNAYPLFASQSTYEGQRVADSSKRVVILTRSAFPGIQRYGTGCWSADISGNWETFRAQVTNGLSFSLCGIPYWTTDTGGFFRPGDQMASPEYNELLQRWFAWSTFCPILRIHGNQTETEMWKWPLACKNLEAFDALRYRFLPYNYSVAWMTTSQAYTPMRALPFDFPNDPKAATIDDQFLSGPALMVSPVTHPNEPECVEIPSAQLIDKNGRPGALTGTYYNGVNFDRQMIERRDASLNFNWNQTSPDPLLARENFSARWEGSIRTGQAGTYAFNISADDGMRLWIYGKLVVDDWATRPAETKTAQVELPASTNVPVKIEYYQEKYDATLTFKWSPPGPHALPLGGRAVYLPAGTRWTDFWTGKSYEGGQTIDVSAQLDQIPLHLRAGSILPLGPALQYAQEKPQDPIELRIYPGADGHFTLYEDEGDNYNCEKGVHATIPLDWNEARHTLTLGRREGQFPGMLHSRTFHVVWVKPGHGVGPEPFPTPDAEIHYTGDALTIRSTGN